MDLSSLTDDELAKISNDKGGEYPTSLSDYARGAVAARMQVTLEPYEFSVGNGDFRGQGMAINKLYNEMSPDTRLALGWTSIMMVANNTMIEGDTNIFGPFSMDTVMANLRIASEKGGLSFTGAKG